MYICNVMQCLVSMISQKKRRWMRKWGNRDIAYVSKHDKLISPVLLTCSVAFPRSTISDNAAMCLNTQNHSSRLEENAVFSLGLACTDWFPWSRFNDSRLRVSMFHAFRALHRVESAYALFFQLESEKAPRYCADCKRNVESAHAFSPTRIEKRGWCVDCTFQWFAQRLQNTRC